MNNNMINKILVCPCIILLCFISSWSLSDTCTAQSPPRFLNKQDKKEVITKIQKLLKDHYIFPDSTLIFEQKLQQNLESGVYDALDDSKAFAQNVTRDLQMITHDKHIKLRLIEASDVSEKKEGSLHHPVRLFRLGQKEHMGYFRLEWLEGNIGYLDLRRFYSPSVSGKMLTHAMHFLSSANAIIIDLRKNQGGDLDPVFLSYFLNHPVQLSSIYYREGDYTQEIWTIEKIEGKRMTDIPLFLLIGKETFSAAEAFAYDLKVLKRAVLAGEPTKGGAHSVDLYKIDDRFEIYISTSRFINPVTRSNWEGSGVVPDIMIPEEQALDTTLVLAKKAADEYGLIKNNYLHSIVGEMQEKLDRAEKLFQSGKDTLALMVFDSAFQAGDKANLLSEFFMEVLAYEYRSRQSEKILIAVLKKNIQLFPDSCNPYLILAMTYSDSGKKEFALPYLEKVLEMEPANIEALTLMKKLKN
jgi:tetratricopeptide (TPR) repeat protein